MFPVSRFDPSTVNNPEKEKGATGENKKKTRKRGRDAVIAEDVELESSGGLRTSTPLDDILASKEAFDDLDIVEGDLHPIGVDEDHSSHPIQDDDAHPASSDTSTTPNRDIQRAQRISKLPIDEAASELGVRPFLVENLRRAGYEHFFPIQALFMPHVLAAQRHPHVRAPDVCISAPTGSGKTLAYVLPVLHALSTRRVVRLRALVVLPSRDLARQVHQVFHEYVRESNLKVGLAVGQSDFRQEQMALTVDGQAQDVDACRRRLAFDPTNLELAKQAYPPELSSTSETSSSLDSGYSTVDVLVCTPGRLVDHLDHTPHFTLQHLQFLIVDEADRLLNQKYHNWIDRVIESANQGTALGQRESSTASSSFHSSSNKPFRTNSDGISYKFEPITWRRFDDSEKGPRRLKVQAVQLRKILVSATLTRDPQKLAALRLCNPRHFYVHSSTVGDDAARGNKYSIPDTLTESLVECTAEQKPLVLLSILVDELGLVRDVRDTNDPSQRKIIVVFTASVDSTHRLARLLQLLWASMEYGDVDSVVEFSSATSQKERSDLLRRCNDPCGGVAVVVCSDGMSRGMDVHSVGVVINYDVPFFAKVYIHRCGRTGRAGKAGKTYTLLKSGQVKQFDRMRALVHHANRVKVIEAKRNYVRDAVANYRWCVRALREVLEAEEDGEFRGTDPLPAEYCQGQDE